MKVTGCPLCDGPGGLTVFQGTRFRVIRADEPGLSAFYRLVWSDHVCEYSDLSLADRRLCIDAVVQIEETLRAHLRPAKVNLATLGNVVAHLHWHVVARFPWDPFFPGSVWGGAQREAPGQMVAEIERLRPALEQELSVQLAARL